MDMKLCEQASLYGSVDIAALPPFLTLLSAPFISKKSLSENARLFENLHLLRMLWLLSFLPSEGPQVFYWSFFLSPPGPCWGTVNWSAALSQVYIHTHTHPSCSLPVIVFTRTQSNLQNEKCNRITLRHRIVWQTLDKLKNIAFPDIPRFQAMLPIIWVK